MIKNLIIGAIAVTDDWRDTFFGIVLPSLCGLIGGYIGAFYIAGLFVKSVFMLELSPPCGVPGLNRPLDVKYIFGGGRDRRSVL